MTKVKQRRSTLPLDEAGRVLEKILVLEQVFNADMVRQALDDNGDDDFDDFGSLDDMEFYPGDLGGPDRAA